MKKLVSLILCIALMGTLLIVPAEAAEKVGGITYELYEDYDRDNANKAFDGENSEVVDLGGRHGKVLKLSGSTSADLTSTQTVNIAGAADDSVSPVAFSFDFYVENINTPIIIEGKNGTDSAKSAFYIKLANGNLYSDGKTNNNTVDATYNGGKWNNITVFRRWNSNGYVHFFLNGVQLGMGGNVTDGITNIDITTLANSANGDAYIDNVRLFTVTQNGASTFEAEAYHDGEYIYIETSFPHNGAVLTPDFTKFNGTEIYDTYTGEKVECAVVSQTGNRAVLKPAAALDAGKKYKVSLPNSTLKGFFYGRSLIASEIYFTAEAKEELVINADSSLYSWKNTDNAAITISTEADGSVKVTNNDTYNKIVTYGPEGDWINTTSVASRYLNANLDFKVDTADFYGRILFNFTSSFNVCYSICSDGKIRVGMNGATAAGNSGNNLIGEITYNVGEWNKLGIKYDRLNDMFTACVNGEEYDLGAYSWDKSKLQKAFKIFWYTNRAVQGTTNAMYFDNVYIANSTAAVEDVKLDGRNIWTKDEISAAAAEAVVTFTDPVRASDVNADKITVTDENGVNVAAGVEPVLAEEGSEAAVQAKIALSESVVSGKEYTVNVTNVGDYLEGYESSKDAASYTGKFTTKDLAISNLAIVNADGTAVEAAPTAVKAKASIDGRTNGIIFVAQYNGGKLTGLTSVTPEMLCGAVETEEYEIKQAEGDLSLKAFIWKNEIESLKPLCDSVTYPNN